MTVEDLKAKLISMRHAADDDDIRTAVENMLFAVELDTEWTSEELEEYWREIVAVERELSRAALLSQLRHHLN